MNINRFKSWCSRNRILLSATCTAVPLIIGLYFERGNIKQLGLPLSVNDVIQALGQFATVGAFWVGFKQLKKANEQASEQAEKEQQMVFMNAAQSQISKMSWVLSQVSATDLRITGLCDFVSTMANLGGNFHGIYEDLREGPEKRVLRIAWQDMLWNELSPKLEQVTLTGLIRDSISHGDLTAANVNAAEMQYRHRYLDEYKEYFKSVNMLDVCAIALPTELRRLLEKENTTFMLFRMYYFDEEYVSDYCKDLVSQPNYRAHVPTIAAIGYYFSNPRTPYLDDPDPI